MKKINCELLKDHDAPSEPYVEGLKIVNILKYTPIRSVNPIVGLQIRLGLIDKHYDNLMPHGFTQTMKFVKTTSRLFRRMKQWIKQNLSK